MIANLIDQTTETFWESSDDDKNKFKAITIQCTHPLENPKALYVHIDNCRDLNVSAMLMFIPKFSTFDVFLIKMYYFQKYRTKYRWSFSLRAKLWSS